MPLRLGRRGTVLLAAAALTATAAGIGWAAIPDGSGEIHACYRRAVGSLRVIDSPSQSCTSGETPLNWSQGGASAAPAGTAYGAYRELRSNPIGSDPIPLGSDWTTIAHIDLPAGSYVATASADFFNHSDAIAWAHCKLTIDGRRADGFGTVSGVQFASQAVTIAGSLSAPGGIDLQCANDYAIDAGRPLEVDNFNLTVVPVGGLTLSAQ